MGERKQKAPLEFFEGLASVSETSSLERQEESWATRGERLSNYSRGDRFPASRMIVTASSPFPTRVSGEITREPAFPLAAILFYKRTRGRGVGRLDDRLSAGFKSVRSMHYRFPFQHRYIFDIFLA